MSQESETFPFSCRFDIIGHADEGRHGSRITAKVRQLLATVTQERLTGFRSFPPFLYVVGVIARQEIIANFRNLKIPAAGVVLSSLFVASAHLLGGDYRERLANWTTNQTAQRDPIVGGVVRYELPDGSFFDSVGTGHDPPLLLPPKPLSVLVKGMDGDFHRPIALGQQIQFGPRQDDKTVPLLFEVPDFSFVVKLIVSLLALFFTADSLTREKESGTLRMLSANPLRRRELLLGKSLGASVSLFLSIGAAYAGVMIYLFSFYGIPGSPDESVRSLLIFSLSLLYGVVFLHLGVFISSLTNRTKTATAVALLLWAVLSSSRPTSPC